MISAFQVIGVAAANAADIQNDILAAAPALFEALGKVSSAPL